MKMKREKTQNFQSVYHLLDKAKSVRVYQILFHVSAIITLLSAVIEIL